MNELTSKIQTLLKMKESIKKLEDELKALKQEYEILEQKIFDEMFNSDIQSIDVSGYKVYRMIREYPRIIDNESFIKWLKENGYSDIIKETVHPQTLRAWFKEFSDKYEFIDELKTMLEIYQEKSLGIRKTE